MGLNRGSELCEIEMLGALRVRVFGETLPRFKSQKVASLLVLLALRLPDAESRERLAELLWPEAEPAASRNNLSVALHSLRSTLEPLPEQKGKMVLADTLAVGLNPATVWTDVSELHSHIRIGRLEEVAQLYRGPLLPGFYVDTILVEADRIQEEMLGVFEELHDKYEEEGSHREAARIASKLVAMDSLTEDHHVRLIRSHREANNPTAALEAYRNLVRMLATNFDEKPSDEATDLVEGLSDRAVAGPTVSIGPASRLPQRITRFFGRQKELDLIQNLVDQERRLITITGLGGMGKTRLAEEAAARFAAKGHAVAFALLSSVSYEQIPGRIAEALNVKPPADNLLGPTVRAALQGRPAILVLDNLEDVLNKEPEKFVELTNTVLRDVPELTLICTSRQTIGIEGEVEMRLEPLPSPQERISLEAARLNPRIQLFVDRAQAAKADFDLTEQNSGEVAKLCRWLEGVPLAIELAAACVRSLPPKAMLKRLNNRLALPGSTFRNVPARHRSIRAVLDTSFELLSHDERRALCAAAVFRGSFDQKALSYLLQHDAVLLSKLVHASLVESFESIETTRYRMLDLVKEYAEHRHAEEFVPAEVKLRHAQHFLQVAETIRPKLDGEGQSLWLGVLSLEAENCLQAIDTLLADPGKVDESLRMISALWRFWAMSGQILSGRPRLEKALSQAAEDESSPALADALNVAGNMAYANEEYTTAIAHHEKSLTLRRTQRDQRGIATALNNLGLCYTRLREYGRARACCEEAISLSSDFADLLALSTGTLAIASAADEKIEQAIECFGACIDMFRALGNHHGAANNLRHLALTLSSNGDFPEARQRIQEALNEAIPSNALPLQIGILGSTATILADEGRLEEANRLHQAAHAIRTELAISYGTGDLRLEQKLTESLAHIVAAKPPSTSLEDVIVLARELLGK